MKIAFVSAMRPGSWKTDLATGISDLGHDVSFHHDVRTFRRPPRTDLVVWAYHQGRAPRFPVDVAVTMDLWIGLHLRERKLMTLDPRIRNFWKAPFVFSPDGSPVHSDRFHELTINHFWLMPACPSRLNYHGDPFTTNPRPPKIVFVGNRNHWNGQRAHMIDILQARHGSDFAWYGAGSPLGPLRDHQLNDLYATGVIVIGDSLGVDYYWSDRVPRTLGQGGFLLQQDTAGFGMAGMFDGVNYAMWTTLETLIDQIDYYLDHPTKRFAMAHAGLTLIKDRHLWEHRAKEIMDTIEGIR